MCKSTCSQLFHTATMRYQYGACRGYSHIIIIVYKYVLALVTSIRTARVHYVFIISRKFQNRLKIFHILQSPQLKNIFCT